MRHLHCCQNVPLETELWLGCMSEDKTKLVNVELQIRTVSFRGQVIIHLEFLGNKLNGSLLMHEKELVQLYNIYLKLNITHTSVHLSVLN